MGVMMNRIVLCVGLALVLPFCALRSVWSQAKTLWEIGKSDQSTSEFHASSGKDVVFQVGASNWERDWPGDQKTGTHYEIRFDLSSAAHGVFLLKLCVQTNYTGAAAGLEVQINGHTGLYYIHPKMFYVMGAGHTAKDTVAIEFPAEYVQMRGHSSLPLRNLVLHEFLS